MANSSKYDQYYYTYTQIWRGYFTQVLDKWKNARCSQEQSDAIASWVTADLRADDLLWAAFNDEFNLLVPGTSSDAAWHAWKQACNDMYEAWRIMSSTANNAMSIPDQKSRLLAKSTAESTKNDVTISGVSDTTLLRQLDGRI